MCYHTSSWSVTPLVCAANNEVLINGETPSFNLRLGYDDWSEI